MNKKTFSLWIILFFILLFALSQSSHSFPGTQKKIKTEEFKFDVGSTFGDHDVFEFNVKKEGTIKVEASWTGDAPQLALILNGPTRQEFARKDGASPLKVSFNVTEDILKKGENWKVSIVNFSRSGSARGAVNITYPEEEKITPLIKFKPKSPSYEPKAKMIIVPNVTGMSLEEAKKTFEERGLKTSVKEINQFNPKYKGKEGQVIGQSQKAGSNLSPGSLVEILWYNPPIVKLPLSTPKKPDIVEPPVKLEKDKRSIKIKYYEIQQSTGFTEQQLEEIKLQLRKQKIADIKTKIERRLKEIAPRNPLAKIMVPMLYQRIEEKSKTHLLIKGVDARPHLQTMVEAYKELSPSFRSQYLHSRYLNLKPGERINKLQLGQDILKAIRPNHGNEIRQMVREAFRANVPKFQWNSAKIQKLPLMISPSKISQFQLRELGSIVSRLRATPSQTDIKLLEKFLRAQGFSATGAPPNHLHKAIAAGLHLPPATIPDLNNDHIFRNYYKYRIELDWFHCIDQNERTCFEIPYIGKECSDDEPYWHLSSVVPRYDPNDPDQIPKLAEGNLYKVDSRVTGTYEDVNNGEDRRFRVEDRLLVNDNTFSTSTTFTISLWEEDSSKRQVREALQEAINDLRDELTETIQEAVLSAMKEALYGNLIEVLPERLHDDLQLFFEGDIDFSTLINRVQSIMGGIDINMIALELIFSGKSIGEIIESLGGACPELTTALMAIKVAGPIVINLFEGDFQEAFQGLLSLPLTLFANIIDFFTDIGDFFEALLAIVDPDDHIQSRTITFDGSADNIWQATVWGEGGYYGADSPYIPNGCGPNRENSSLISGSGYEQPILTFMGADAKYYACYNVKRTLGGGRETFGYTVKGGSESYKQKSFMQERTYKSKAHVSGKKIKVSVCALNTEAVPFVWLQNVAEPSMVGGNLGGEREFYVDSRPGAEYRLVICYFGEEAMYGYVTLEEQ